MTEQVVAGSLVALGLGYAARQGWALRREAGSRDWPRARGQVRHASMTILTTAAGHGQRRLGDVEPYVCVAYVVDGMAYETRTVRWHGVAAWAARRTLARYPVGSMVPVAYDPKAPGRGVLEPGATLLRVWQFVIGLALALLGAAWLAAATAA